MALSAVVCGLGSGGEKPGWRKRRRRQVDVCRSPWKASLVADPTGAVSDYTIGDRVFHQKFGHRQRPPSIDGKSWSCSAVDHGRREARGSIATCSGCNVILCTQL